jgi:hypothetical protein
MVVVAVCALLSKPDHVHHQRLKNGEHVNWSLAIMMYYFIKQVLKQREKMGQVQIDLQLPYVQTVNVVKKSLSLSDRS